MFDILGVRFMHTGKDVIQAGEMDAYLFCRSTRGEINHTFSLQYPGGVKRNGIQNWKYGLTNPFQSGFHDNET